MLYHEFFHASRFHGIAAEMLPELNKDELSLGLEYDADLMATAALFRTLERSMKGPTPVRNKVFAIACIFVVLRPAPAPTSLGYATTAQRLFSAYSKLRTLDHVNVAPDGTPISFKAEQPDSPSLQKAIMALESGYIARTGEKPDFLTAMLNFDLVQNGPAAWAKIGPIILPQFRDGSVPCVIDYENRTLSDSELEKMREVTESNAERIVNEFIKAAGKPPDRVN